MAKNKQDIDWAEREAKLKTLCDRYRSRNSSYDCLVPGSGGKDSFYAAYKLKYEYGMNPLTVTWRHISTLIEAGEISSRGSMPALITTFSRRTGGVQAPDTIGC